MKRTIFLFILFSVIVTFGCTMSQSSSRDILPGPPSKVSYPSLPYTDDEGRLIVGRMGGRDADWPNYMLSPKTVAEKAEIIVIGTIVSVEDAKWVRNECTSYAIIECTRIIKGDPPKTFTFSYGGGYMTYKEYMNRWGEPAEKEYSYLTKEQKDTAYFIGQADDKNLPKVGGEYLLLLNHVGEADPWVMGIYQGIFRIEGDRAYQTDSGPAISLEELLQMVTS